VFCFSPEDNVFHPWKADGKMHGKIPQSILANDAPYQDFLAQQYRELHGGKEPPEAAARQGSFADWSYFQYGRWTFAARGWWPGKVAADAKPPGKEEPEKKKEEEKKLDEKRGKEDLDYLRWLTSENLPGFVEWQAIDHPQFPGKKVEVGGFKPFYRTHPAVAVIETLVPKQIAFLHKLVEARPKIALVEKKIEPLAGQLFRVTATLTNSGHLPTLSEMGETVGIHQRLQIQLQLPEQTRYLQGSPRVKLTRIEPQAKREVVWLVQLPAAQPTKGTLKIWSPEMDAVQQEIELIPQP
jgi:hypothetical protein